MLMRVIPLATPLVVADALPFMGELFERLNKMMLGGADMAVISKYYASIVSRVSRPTKKYFVADGGFCHAQFDRSWIHANTDEMEELQINWQQKRAIAAVSGFKKPRGDDPPRESKKDKKLRLAKERIAQGDPADDGQLQIEHVERAPHVDKNADAVPIPKKNGKMDLDAVKAEQQRLGIGLNGTQPPCWNYNHPQGCKAGAKCRYHHL